MSLQLRENTTDKDKYISHWNAHIIQIIYLGHPLLNASESSELFDELVKIKERLLELTQIAADEDFK